MNGLLDGRPASTLPLDDRGLHYGDGLFETVRVTAGVPEYWSAHCLRLEEGCRRLDLPAPDRALLEREVAELFADGGDGILKLWYSRGGGGRGYLPPAEPQPRRLLLRYPPRPRPEKPATVRLCTTRLARQPLLAGIKHLNRLEQVLARREWGEGDAIDEGLLCDTDGHLVEAVQSNLFWVRGGVLETPDLSASGVAGIMREQVLGAAARLGLETRTVRRTAPELREADEVFLTNSVIGIWPVANWEEKCWSAPGTVTTRLMAAVEQSRVSC